MIRTMKSLATVLCSTQDAKMYDYHIYKQYPSKLQQRTNQGGTVRS